MATSARQSRVRFQGLPTAFAGAPLELVEGNTYRLTNPAYRLLDPADGGTSVYDGSGALVSTDNYLVDWLFGEVTFVEGLDPMVLPLTMSGSYLPTVDIGEVREHSLSVSATVHDVTVYGEDAHLRLTGLGDVSGSFVSLLRDDETGGLRTLDSLRGSAFVLELAYPDGSLFRAWVRAESIETAGSTDGLIETTVNFVGASQGAALLGGGGTGFGWGT